MGKRPLLGFLGLVMAGIALTGCGECCRNNNMRPGKFGSKGAFDKATPAPAPTPTPAPSPPPGMIGDSRLPPGGEKTLVGKEPAPLVNQVNGSAIPRGVKPDFAPPAPDAPKPMPALGPSVPLGAGASPGGLSATSTSLGDSQLAPPPPKPVRNTFAGGSTALPSRPLLPGSVPPLPTGGTGGNSPPPLPTAISPNVPAAPLPPMGGTALPPLPGASN